jgi:hypothetical protein
VIQWLISAALGPAAVALPVSWVGTALAREARRWFRRLRRADGLSRLVRGATGTEITLTPAEFESVRRLLEDPATWRMLGQEPLEKLVSRTAACLALGHGRTTESRREAALVIVRGLLDFAAADIDPGIFRQLVLARLQRLEVGQASALDRALFDLHGDLVVGFGRRADAEERAFAAMMEQFKRILDRLPAASATRGDVAVYLHALVTWLSSDPWPRDLRLGGPVLTPASIERKLSVTTRVGRRLRQVADADELAQRCARLVILGGPGSGKTWLAKRTARQCAERALTALADGADLSEVELPMYTTCSHLFGATGIIRMAAVTSALDQLGDLGGARISVTIRDFLAERNAPAVLVIDSLDEASGSDERLRQADTLPWRIVLTSRPSSWNEQLSLEEASDDHQVGVLQPLRYPDDVVPFIHRWFAQQARWGHDLAAQIARRPELQQSATVPLILAFYCIVGGNAPLPESRSGLYVKVLRRMLTGRWRGLQDPAADVDACLATLRAWAWSAVAGHPVSGVGEWIDDFVAPKGAPGTVTDAALDHVATPIGPADVDTGRTQRRFIHRYIREHLVAEHITGVPADEAAGALLPHLWFDSDWEYSAPAAIAMHPERDRVLRRLLLTVAESSASPADLPGVDPECELRGFLARVAAESDETDWPAELAGLIGRARVDLAASGQIRHLCYAPSWETSSRRACLELLRSLSSSSSPELAARLVSAMLELVPDSQERQQARGQLLRLLGIETDGSVVGAMVDKLLQLVPDQAEQHETRASLLQLMATAPTGPVAAALARGLVLLDPTAEDKAQARANLLRLLDRERYGPGVARQVASLLALDPTAEDKRQARGSLLALLDRQFSGSATDGLTAALRSLEPTAEDKSAARKRLLAILPMEQVHFTAVRLAGELLELDATIDDKRAAKEILLGTLSRPANGDGAGFVAGRLMELDATRKDRVRAHRMLRDRMRQQSDGAGMEGLAQALLELGPDAAEKSRARGVLLGLLDRQADGSGAARLVAGLLELGPDAAEKSRARGVLLGLLDRQADGSGAARVVAGLLELGPDAAEKSRARGALLGLLDRLARGSAGVSTARLTAALTQLEPTPADMRRARGVLLGLLASSGYGLLAVGLVGGLIQLEPEADEMRQARQLLTTRLSASATDSALAGVVNLVEKLDLTAADKRQIRDVVVEMLARPLDYERPGRLMELLIRLDPVAADLESSHLWSQQPTARLLAATRRNTATDNWLAALPRLVSSPGGTG